jgi:hypothetical protein
MHKNTLKLALALPPLLMGLITAASIVGATQMPLPALKGFVTACEAVKQACWYGVIPGLTRMHEADRILQQFKYAPVQNASDSYGRTVVSYITDYPTCNVRLRFFGTSDRVNLIQLQCQEVRLGDVAALFGQPERILRVSNYSTRLWFRGGVSAIFSVRRDLRWPYSRIFLIDVSAPVSNEQRLPAFG